MPARQTAVIDAMPDDPVGLGGNHHLVEATTECSTNELLGRFPVCRSRSTWPVEDWHICVHVSGVNEVDAKVERFADKPIGVLCSRCDSESGSAERDLGHSDTGRTKDGVLHKWLPSLVQQAKRLYGTC
jgi:hypothetical protein